MSDLNPQTTPPPADIHQQAQDPAFCDEGRPPRSRIAIVAFVMSLVLLMPCLAGIATRVFGFGAWLPTALACSAGGLLAAALGIVGIVKTSARRRRGRGLAIAAIPLGAFAATIELMSGVGVHTHVLAAEHSAEAINILKTSRSHVQDKASRWYQEMTSPGFRDAVTEAGFAKWLDGIIAEHGQLQNHKRKRGVEAGGGLLTFNFAGRFVNGAESIKVSVLPNLEEPKVANIRVGDSSPLRAERAGDASLGP